jgi:flagellar protein FliS
MTAALSFRAPAPSSARPCGQGGLGADPYGFSRLLMDGALERIDAARGQPWSAEMHSLLQSAVMIIGELRADLDLVRGGAIAANLDDLYDYMCRRLRAGDLQNGIAALDEVSYLLDALRAAWTFMPAEVRSATRN